MIYNYIMIDDTQQLSIMLNNLNTSKLLEYKLASISHEDIHDRIYDFDSASIYPGHYHVLKYMLNNGYLTNGVVDFSKTIADITETGGGCMYVMLDIHTKFMQEIRRLCVKLDSSCEDTPPYLVRCPYLDELQEYHTSLIPVDEDEQHCIQHESLPKVVYRQVMRRDIPNFVYVILVVALVKLI
jgi:hypothetical protein